MKKYELMYILRPNLDEATLKAEKEGLSKLLTDKGAKLGKISEWGLKDLAYEIKKEKKGYYVVLEFEANNNDVIENFNKIVKLNNNVLRFLIVKAIA